MIVLNFVHTSLSTCTIVQFKNVDLSSSVVDRLPRALQCSKPKPAISELHCAVLKRSAFLNLCEFSVTLKFNIPFLIFNFYFRRSLSSLTSSLLHFQPSLPSSTWQCLGMLQHLQFYWLDSKLWFCLVTSSTLQSVVKSPARGSLGNCIFYKIFPSLFYIQYYSLFTVLKGGCSQTRRLFNQLGDA